MKVDPLLIEKVVLGLKRAGFATDASSEAAWHVAAAAGDSVTEGKQEQRLLSKAVDWLILTLPEVELPLAYQV